MMNAPEFWYTPSISPPFWARALSRIYGYARKIHVALTHPKDAPIPTLCVGNITTGGAGKTPVVRALRALLNDYHTTVLLRGYGGKITTPTWVTPAHTAQDIGDEAMLHARDGPVIIAKNRYDGAVAGGKKNTKLLILDDGLQNRSLRAHLNILVIDGATGFGNSQLLPAGPLRELLPDLIQRIQAVILIGDDTTNARAALPPHLPVFTAHAEYDPLPHTMPYLAFSGLAQPKKFYTALSEMGARVIATHDFADHHAYTDQDIEHLRAEAQKNNARLITTEKDHVKIPSRFHPDIDILKMRVVFDTPETLKTFIDHRIKEISCP